jgi:hypothetical protein
MCLRRVGRLAQRRCASDTSGEMRFDTRNLGILLGAAMLIGALSAPWFVLDLGQAREAINAQVGQLPGGFGEFARQIVSRLPDHISVDGWTAFDRNDIVLLFAALAASLAALLDRHDVATLAGGAAAGIVVIAMLSHPGHVPSQYISLSWGPWLALGGAALIVVASRMSSEDEHEPAASTEVDWFAHSEALERERVAAAASVSPPA